ncbi:hypothetical protein P4N68_12525 [Corynebacterium felinum]|uniref:HAMP domain-containing protein n=1 Tax=Corynebacterium felinum TaxID=131318 RepID=A0ABU2B9H0_9CORY|nr:hypothetical protein [Corynebacterium felinum]MDF5821892.1 hypothetical protein [Corynebacterium felinum]MDR7355295.1 hypothetical protein [Corynebacterium felinum]WJY94648.1 hypothetical protein CFELI_05095 [Corynebacterium felinum]
MQSTQASLRKRMALWCMVAAGLSLVAGLLTARSLLMVSINEEAHREIAQEISEFQAFVAAAEGIDSTETLDPSVAAELLPRYLSKQIPDDNQALVGIIHGKIVGLKNAPNPLSPGLVASLDGATGVAQDPLYGDIHWAKIELDSASLVVAQFIDKQVQQIHYVLGIVLAIGLVGVAICGFLAWIISGQFFHPLAQLRQAIIEADRDDSRLDVDSISGLETQDLAAVVDVALERARIRAKNGGEFL